ncbi:MAG: histone-lysine N-methyltransferase, partial [Eggerthellaceae bacterium]|nr:histone-lysine N-methyltransferase [Eggerthellaceae bacterium]
MPKHARNDRDATFWENAEQDLELATQERYAQGDYPQDYSYPDYRDAFDGAYFDSEYQEPDQYLDLFPQDEDFPYQEGRRSRRTDKPELHPMQRRSRKIRRTLIVVIVLLIALIGATIYFNYQLLEEARRQAIEQVTHNDPTDTDKLKDDDPHDATTATTKKTDVVYLVALIGMGQDDAIRAIGHGATIVSSLPIKEEGNPIRTELKVSLTEEPGDTRSGTPTVYLALDGAGVIIRAGYSAAITTLGY